MFDFCQPKEIYHQNQRHKMLILKFYVFLLNYPFKSDHPWLSYNYNP